MCKTLETNPVDVIWFTLWPSKEIYEHYFYRSETDDQIVDCISSSFESCFHSSFKICVIKNIVYAIF